MMPVNMQVSFQQQVLTQAGDGQVVQAHRIRHFGNACAAERGFRLRAAEQLGAIYACTRWTMPARSAANASDAPPLEQNASSISRAPSCATQVVQINVSGTVRAAQQDFRARRLERRGAFVLFCDRDEGSAPRVRCG